MTVWFYVAAGAALLAGMGFGLWLAGGVAGSADAYRALRLAHVHLNVLGWVGLAVVGTQFTRGRRCCAPAWCPGWNGPSAGRCRRWPRAWPSPRPGWPPGTDWWRWPAWPPILPGWRSRWSRSSARPRRPPTTAAAWMLGAGMAWLVVTVVADLGALAASRSVAGLEGRVARLVPAVVAGFALQTLTGALTYLLPVVSGAHGNRRLGRILDLGWPVRFAAVNTGVLLLVTRAAAPTISWWLVGLGLASFAPGRRRWWPRPAAGEPCPPQPDPRAARASAPPPRRQAVKTRPARATSLSSIRPIA